MASKKNQIYIINLSCDELNIVMWLKLCLILENFKEKYGEKWKEREKKKEKKLI